jgi:DNA-binding GntR family transcriptional regulator
LTVFAALLSRDSEGADAAMRTHLTRQRDALRALSAQQSSQTSRVTA